MKKLLLVVMELPFPILTDRGKPPKLGGFLLSATTYDCGAAIRRDERSYTLGIRPIMRRHTRFPYGGPEGT